MLEDTFILKSNRSPHVKRVVVHSLYNRETIVCQDRYEFMKKGGNIRCNLALNGYPKSFTNTVINRSDIKS